MMTGIFGVSLIAVDVRQHLLQVKFKEDLCVKSIWLLCLLNLQTTLSKNQDFYQNLSFHVFNSPEGRGQHLPGPLLPGIVPASF